MSSGVTVLSGGIVALGAVEAAAPSVVGLGETSVAWSGWGFRRVEIRRKKIIEGAGSCVAAISRIDGRGEAKDSELEEAWILGLTDELCALALETGEQQ